MKKLFGFSVLELLVLLVTISIVAAALAPVFTKRVRSVNATVNPSQVSQNCANRFSAYCTSCNLRQCLTCDRQCKQNEVLRISTCTCHTCSSFFPNCFACAEQQCTKCMQGYYLNKNNNTNCIPCEKAHYCNGYYEIMCTYGTYQNSTTKDYCIKCPEGTYQDERQKDSCKDCPEGFYCPKLQTRVPIKCAPGYYSEKKWANCQKCPGGTRPNLYQTGCVDCEAGTYAQPGDAKFIANGQYETKTKENTWSNYYAGEHQCLPCEEGYYSAAKAAKCSKCLEGYFSKKPEGYYGATSCTKCPAGTYSKDAGSSRCHDCNAGQYSAAGATGCSTCGEGYYSKAHSKECTKCPVGYFSRYKGNTNLVNVTTSGKVPGDYVGPANCTKCPGGYYQPYEAKNFCYTVPCGHWSTEAATSYTACEPGYYQPHVGQKSCKSCQAGKYNTGTGNCYCYNCGKGKTSTKALASTECKKCAVGQEGTEDVNISCVDCKAGYYAPTEGTISCLKCAKNKYSYGKAGTCYDCLHGMTSSAGSGFCTDKDEDDETYTDHKY